MIVFFLLYNFDVKVKVFVFFLIYCICISYVCMFFSPTIFASQTYYAQISTNQTYIYQEPQNSDNAKLFLLPKTYFVELLSSYDDKFFSARYDDVYGYVLKNQVKPILGVPQTPFLNDINFRIFVPSGADLRATPYNNGTVNLVYNVPFLDNNLAYYGIVQGEELISKKGKTWYYCKYYTDNLSYTGYVYAPLCDCLSTITENTEQVEFIDPSSMNFKDDILQSSTDTFAGLSQTATTIIIIAISLPCLLLIYLLFKPTRLAQDSQEQPVITSKNKKKKIKRLKNSDYFEFDDDF